jgi:thiamine-phosphate pyrophosphorylase
MVLAALPRLVAITDLTRSSAVHVLERSAELAQSARPGSFAVLLRDHQASPRERLALGRELSRLLRAAEQQLWIADRLDLALLLAADALHLGEGSVPARDARALLGPDQLVSRAWHDAGPLSEAALSELYGADNLLLSPILQARKGRPALGLAALGAFVSSLKARGNTTSVMALGGVSAGAAPACLAAGAQGVAAIAAAWSSDAVELVRALGIER